MGGSSNLKGVTSQGKNISKNFDVIKFTDMMLKFLRENNYYVVWKEREKGYPRWPVGGWDNVLNHTKNIPDVVIKKDLNFPSSLIDLATIADISIVLNFSTVYEVMTEITNNVINIDTNQNFDEQMKKIINISNKQKKLRYVKNASVSKNLVSYVEKNLI